MKKYLFIAIIIFHSYNSQTVLLEENFEDYQDFTISSFGDWQLLDLDGLYTVDNIGGDPAPPVNWIASWPNAGSKMAYQIFNFSQSNASNDYVGTTGDIRNFFPRSGQKYAACWGAKMVQSYKGNDDWLITRAVTLGTSGNIISMYLKTLSSSYGDQQFQIGVYNGTGNPTKNEDFIIINPQNPLYSPHPTFGNYQTVPQNANIEQNWRNFTYNLDAFAGQTIKVGIHCISQEGSALLVDDVKITTSETLQVSENFSSEDIRLFPNPTSGRLFIQSKNNIKSAKLLSKEGRMMGFYHQFPINIEDLENGNYFLQILFNDETQITTKIIKK